MWHSVFLLYMVTEQNDFCYYTRYLVTCYCMYSSSNKSTDCKICGKVWVTINLHFQKYILKNKLGISISKTRLYVLDIGHRILVFLPRHYDELSSFYTKYEDPSFTCSQDNCAEIIMNISWSKSLIQPSMNL